MRKKTKGDFINMLNELTDYTYELVGEFSGMSKEVTLLHKTCSTKYSTTPNNILRTKKGNCPMCGKTTKKDNRIFTKDINKLVGDEYTFLDRYVSSSYKLRVRHNSPQCNYNEYYVTPNDFKNGRRCLVCSSNAKKTQDTFVSEVWNLVVNEYTVVGNYVGVHEPIKLIHNVCGREINMTPGNFLRGSRCVHCKVDSTRLTEEEFCERVKEKTGDSYSIVGDYINNKTPVLIKHDLCGEVSLIRPDWLMQGRTSCKNCGKNRSIGERIIHEYLVENNIPFVEQHSFKDLPNHYYDFYLEEYNTLIEYQGIQHFEPTTFGGMSYEEAENKLKSQVVRDQNKRDYANRKCITLLEPTYKISGCRDIYDYLNKNLHKY